MSVAAAAVATAWDGVSLVAASSSLSGAIRELDGEVGSHLCLKEKLALSSAYDICLIDTSPSLNILVVNALCASRYLFIPLSSKYFSLQGLGQTLEAFAKVKGRLNPELAIVGMAFVIHDSRSSLAREVGAEGERAVPRSRVPLDGGAEYKDRRGAGYATFDPIVCAGTIAGACSTASWPTSC